jgi:DNA polymerase-3 subunit epsilon
MQSHRITRGQDRYQCVVCGCSWHKCPDRFLPCLGVWCYTPGQPVPDYLKSQTQLAAAHLRPGGLPVGYYYEARGKKAYWFWLYDEREAHPRRQATEAQLAALAKARQTLLERSTCQRCSQRFQKKARWPKNGLCSDCRAAIRRRARIADWARALLEEGTCLVLDTETSGLNDQAEVVEIAAIDMTGAVCLNARIRPQGRIPEQVSRMHGITNQDVASAPSFADLWPEIRPLLSSHKLLIYNAEFDRRLLYQSYAKSGLTAAFPLPETECLMWAYAEFAGSRNRNGDYAWWSLADACWNLGVEGGDHSALGDCQASLRLLKALAQYREPLYEARLAQEAADEQASANDELQQAEAIPF